MNKQNKNVYSTDRKSVRAIVLSSEKAPRRFDRTLEQQMETDLTAKAQRDSKPARKSTGLNLDAIKMMPKSAQPINCKDLSAEQVSRKYTDRVRRGKTAKAHGRRGRSEAQPLATAPSSLANEKKGKRK